LKRKGWETLRDGEEIMMAYHRPDDWHWVIKTTNLADACGERDAVAISGNKRWMIMAELYLAPGPKNLNEKELKDVLSMFDGMNITPKHENYGDMVIEGAVDYGKTIQITTAFASDDQKAVAKILRIKEVDLDGDLSPWFNKIVNMMGMTGMELLRGDMDTAFKRIKEEAPRTVRKDENSMARSISQKDLTSECWLVQMWGSDRCNTCNLKDTDDCGGKKIRMTGRNERGIIVPIPDAKP
jgi:hypothetical protein